MIEPYNKLYAIVDRDKIPNKLRYSSRIDMYRDKDNWYIECSNESTKKYYERKYGVDK